MRVYLSVTIMMLIASRPDGGLQGATSMEEILRAEEARLRAVEQADVRALDRLMTANYTVVTLAGALVNKEGELALYATGARRQQQLKDTGLKVRIYDDGNAAVVTGLGWRKDVLRETPREFQFRFTDVWVRQEGRWQVAARHATAIADLPATTGSAAHSGDTTKTLMKPAETFSPSQEAVYQAHLVLHDGHWAADSGTISRFLTDDWFVTTATGQVIDRAARIASLVHRAPPLIQDEIRIRMYGNFAIMTLRTVLAQGKPQRGTSVWVKQDGQWKQAANQQTFINE